MTDGGAGTATAALPRRLQLFFSAMDKVIRGIRLYQGEGPVLAQMAREQLSALTLVVTDGPVSVKVASVGVVYETRPVTDTENRPAYLFRLYLDGVRELTFLPGIDVDELGRFTSVLATDPKGKDDLVTLLWGAGLRHIQYYAVDSYGEAASGGSSSLVRDQAGQQVRTRGDGTQVSLSSADVRALRTEDVAHWVRRAGATGQATGDNERAMATALREGWAGVHDTARFMELVTRLPAGPADADGEDSPAVSPFMLELWDSAVRVGNLPNLVAVLGRLAAPGVDEDAGLCALRTAVTSPERLRRLAPHVMAHADALVPALSALVHTGRDGVLALIAALPPCAAVEELQGAMGDAGVDLTPLHARRLQEGDEAAQIAAIEALGATGSAESQRALVTALSSPLGSVRFAALQAMDGHYVEAARLALGKALRDPRKENRLLALEILAGSGDARVHWLLLSAAEHSSFQDHSADEQQAVVKALAADPDPRTVPYFDGLLERRSAVGGAVVVPLQLIAVDALAAIGTDDAKAALKRAAGRFLLAPAIKTAAQAALARLG